VSRFTPFLLLLLSACSPGPKPDSVAEVGTDANSGAPPISAKATDEPACVRLTAEEAEGLKGLLDMGRSGDHQLYGRPRELLCSEPGPGGRGECALVGGSSVKIVRGSEVFGFRAAPGAGSVLRYGPESVTCDRPSGAQAP